jgi:hypothetical protein
LIDTEILEAKYGENTNTETDKKSNCMVENLAKHHFILTCRTNKQIDKQLDIMTETNNQANRKTKQIIKEINK